MVTFIEDSRIQHREHYLKVVKEINGFEIDKLYVVNIQPMTGKIFKPGKTKDGKKWLDETGKKDTRIMVMGASGYPECYHVFKDKKEIDDTFEELSYDTYQAVTNPA